MIVISDTTPIITLLKINQLDLLKELFGKVYIPDRVYKELIQDKRFINEANIIRNVDYILVEVLDEQEVQKVMISTNLDDGESAAICLYEKQAEKSLLLIDEKRGRKVAKLRNINIIGTIGLLALAYKHNIRSKEQIKTIVEEIKIKRKSYTIELLDELLKIIEN